VRLLCNLRGLNGRLQLLLRGPADCVLLLLLQKPDARCEQAACPRHCM
jgi:hypothetical protein